MTEYMSLKQFCEKWHKQKPVMLQAIKEERLPAVMIGNQWAIPADAQPPADRRIKTGKYIKEPL